MKKIKEYISQHSIERSVTLLAVLASIESLQILVIVVLIFSFFPIPTSDFYKDLFPYMQPGVQPKHDMLFFHVWVMTAILIHAAGMWLLRKRLGEAKADGFMTRLIMVDGWWLLMQLFTAFKMIMYPQATWVKPLFYVFLGLSLLSRLFWIEVDAFLLKADELLPRWSSQMKLRAGADVLVLLFLVLCLWIFDQERLWAVIDLTGSRALADQGWRDLSPLIKGIDYAQTVPWLIILSLFYYGIFYIFLRWFSGSVLLAGAGMLLAVKWQYFHNGVAPNIWQFPSKSIVPLLPDVFFWVCLLAHTRINKQWCLWLAGTVSGFYLGYHFQTGVWLWLAWAAYLVMIRARTAWYFWPWVVGAGLWLVFLGFQGTFDLMDRSSSLVLQTLQGTGGIALTDCLKRHNFFVFSAQFIIPVIYFVTMVTARQKEAKLLMIPVSIYGLGLFTVHIWQPSLSNYDSVSSPLVIVLCFWASQALALLPLARRIVILSLLLIIYAGALLTNNLFGTYPNIWNVAGVNWTQIKAVHQQQMAGGK